MKGKWAIASHMLIIALMLIAAYVTGAQAASKAWPPIVAYWAILTVKNFCDWRGNVK